MDGSGSIAEEEKGSGGLTDAPVYPLVTGLSSTPLRVTVSPSAPPPAFPSLMTTLLHHLSITGGDRSTGTWNRSVHRGRCTTCRRSSDERAWQQFLRRPRRRVPRSREWAFPRPVAPRGVPSARRLFCFGEKLPLLLVCSSWRFFPSRLVREVIYL